MNYYKNDPKKSSRFILHYKMLTQTTKINGKINKIIKKKKIYYVTMKVKIWVNINLYFHQNDYNNDQHQGLRTKQKYG